MKPFKCVLGRHQWKKAKYAREPAIPMRVCERCGREELEYDDGWHDKDFVDFAHRIEEENTATVERLVRRVLKEEGLID